MAAGLRIAFLDSWWQAPARGSGTAVGISGLAGGLAAAGHRVTRLAPLWGAPGHLATRLLYNLEVPSRLRRARFDLVVGFDWDGWAHRAPDGVPYVACLKGVLADEMRFERGLPRTLLGLQSTLEAANARRAGRVVTPSDYSKRRVCAAYGLSPAKVAVVPEGIDPARWAAPGGKAGPPTILNVARQYPRKNTRTLLLAMPAVRRAVPGACLRIVGGGPELPALKRLAARLGLQDAVRFLGPVPESARVRDEYARAHVFCLPSLQEGFGIAYLEAMAAGLPVVAGDAAAAAEVVPPGEVGELIPPRDAEALADSLVRLLADSALRARMGAAGRRRAEAFAWPRVARRFLAEVGA